MSENVEIKKSETKRKKFTKDTAYCVTVKVMDPQGSMSVFYTNYIPYVEDDTLVVKISDDKIVYFNQVNVISYGISRLKQPCTIKEDGDIDGEDN